MSEPTGMANTVPGLPASEIYRRLTSGAGTEPLEQAERILDTLARREQARSRRIGTLADEIGDGRRGSTSGERPAGAAGPLAGAALAGADLLREAQERVARQARAVRSALAELRQVPAQPPEPDFVEPRFPFRVDHARRLAGYQLDTEHNMRVFGRYESAGAAETSEPPQAPAPPEHPATGISLVTSQAATAHPAISQSASSQSASSQSVSSQSVSSQPVVSRASDTDPAQPDEVHCGVLPPPAPAITAPSNPDHQAVPESPDAQGAVQQPVVPARLESPSPEAPRSLAVSRGSEPRPPAALSPPPVQPSERPSAPGAPAEGPSRSRPHTNRNPGSATDGVEFGPVAGYDPGTGFATGEFGPNAGYAGNYLPPVSGAGSRWSVQERFTEQTRGSRERAAENGAAVRPEEAGSDERKPAMFLVEPDETEDLFTSDRLTAPPVIGE